MKVMPKFYRLICCCSMLARIMVYAAEEPMNKRQDSIELLPYENKNDLLNDWRSGSFVPKILGRECHAAACSSDGKMVGVGGLRRCGLYGNLMRDHYLKLLNLSMNSENQRIVSEHAVVTALAFSSAGILVSGDSLPRYSNESRNYYGSVKLWSPPEFDHPREILQCPTTGISTLFFASRPDSLIVCSKSKTIEWWDLNEIKVTMSRWWVEDFHRSSLSVSSDDKFVIFGPTDFGERGAKVWNTETDKIEVLKNVPKELVTASKFSPVGHLLALGFADGTIILWDLKETKKVWQIAGSNERVDSIAFSQAGGILAVAFMTVIRLFDAATGNFIAAPVIPDYLGPSGRRLGPIKCFQSGLTFLHHGKKLLARADDTAILWGPSE